MPVSSSVPKNLQRYGEDGSVKRVVDGAGRIWVVAGVITLVAFLLVVALFRTPPVSSKPVRPTLTPTQVELTQLGKEGDKLLREQADLYDPTPLFLPTEWNARPNDLPVNSVRGPSDAFQGFASKPTFKEDSARLTFPAPIEVPAKPVDALAVGPPEMPFAGMGRSDRALPLLSPRNAFMEVAAAGTGKLAIALALQDFRLPAETDWSPLEFLVAVDRAGLVGSPRLTASSGVEQVDLYCGKYLVNELQLGGRLEPGFYRIKIGP